MKPVVVGLGEVLWDMLPGGRKLGGAPANFACHAQHLGADGRVVSAVGDDDLGHDLLAALQSMGLTSEHIQVSPGRSTGTVTVRVDDQGKPHYVIHEGVAWDNMTFGSDLVRLAAMADAVCVGSLAQRCEATRTTTQQFLDATRPACWRVFDLNLRQAFYSRDVVATTLYKTRLMKLNDEEWPVLAGLLELPVPLPDGLKMLCNRFGVEVVALTRGPEGSLVYSRDGLHALPAARVEVADTVGAGDAFTAALTMGLLRGCALPVAHEHAARVAAYVCTRHGATPNLPPNLVRCV